MCHYLHCEEVLLFFRPDGIGTVLSIERVMFEEIKDRLRHLLENQITHFRFAVQINVRSILFLNLE